MQKKQNESMHSDCNFFLNHSFFAKFIKFGVIIFLSEIIFEICIFH